VQTLPCQKARFLKIENENHNGPTRRTQTRCKCQGFGPLAGTLSRAKNTAVNGLFETGIVSARGGKVQQVKRDELPADRDLTTDKRLTAWEPTQHLIRALDQHGESGAADLLRKLCRGFGENAREPSYLLFKICERKSWSIEELAYNSLVLARPELTIWPRPDREPENWKCFRKGNACKSKALKSAITVCFVWRN